MWDGHWQGGTRRWVRFRYSTDRIFDQVVLNPMAERPIATSSLRFVFGRDATVAQVHNLLDLLRVCVYILVYFFRRVLAGSGFASTLRLR